MVGNNLFILLIGAQITGHYLLCCWLLVYRLNDAFGGRISEFRCSSWCTWKWTLVSMLYTSRRWRNSDEPWTVAHKINDIAVQLGLTSWFLNSVRAYRGPESDRSHLLCITWGRPQYDWQAGGGTEMPNIGWVGPQKKIVTSPKLGLFSGRKHVHRFDCT